MMGCVKMTDTAFLRFKPTVCAVEEDYVILLATSVRGMALLEIGEEIYHDTRAGVCLAEADFFQIRVPQSALNTAREYTVVFRPSLGKESYFTVFAPHKTLTLPFRPVEKTENIHMYHLSDVHGRFDRAKRTASYFDGEIDLFIVNGDLLEFNFEEEYSEALAFLGEIGEGSVPMIFSRGNHDTRGRLSERFTDYFPTANGKTYYTVKLGPLHVLVLDGGEDKPDKCAPYDNTADVPEKYRGLNRFHEYRREEAHFLKDLADRGEKFDFAVSHICPHMRNNIDADVYAEWMASLDRLGIQFMLCGHYHRCSLIDKENTATVFPRSYPIIVASGVMEDDYHGGAITYFSNRIEIAFTNTKREVVANHVIPFA